MFVLYSKIRINLSIKKKLKLRIKSYFVRIDVCFRKAIMYICMAIKYKQ